MLPHFHYNINGIIKDVISNFQKLSPASIEIMRGKTLSRKSFSPRHVKFAYQGPMTSK
jgi:hypothetical protein